MKVLVSNKKFSIKAGREAITYVDYTRPSTKT